MANKQDVDYQQASVPTDLLTETIHAGSQSFNNSSHVGGSDNPVCFVELLRHVPSLSLEVPEANLRLVTRLDEIYALGLRDDRMFATRILSFV